MFILIIQADNRDEICPKENRNYIGGCYGKKIIGIDLGGTTVKLAVLTVEGAIERQWSIITDTSEGGINIIGDIVATLKEHLHKFQIDLKDIVGIGMGSPGQVDCKEGTVTGAYNLGWWCKQHVRSIFEDAFGLPFYLDNDANVAAMGERWKGAGAEADDIIFVTLGTGVGVGIIVDGKLVHGATACAGEIGHIVVDPGGFQCTCGNRGCLETVASATGIMNLTKVELSRSQAESQLKILANNGKIDAKDVFDLAKSGDVLAQAIVDRFAFYLGLACGQLANTLNPRYIIIGGGVSKAGEFLKNKVEEQFSNFVLPTVKDRTELRLASLGNEAGVIGAAGLVIL
ncbi:MAG: ROK family glucokinase [Erysipelotrichaceae bacterium]|nr:ROK family glucokinase [Erysipelotrichaceae bacterium]